MGGCSEAKMIHLIWKHDCMLEAVEIREGRKIVAVCMQLCVQWLSLGGLQGKHWCCGCMWLIFWKTGEKLRINTNTDDGRRAQEWNRELILIGQREGLEVGKSQKQVQKECNESSKCPLPGGGVCSISHKEIWINGEKVTYLCELCMI